SCGEACTRTPSPCCCATWRAAAGPQHPAAPRPRLAIRDPGWLHEPTRKTEGWRWRRPGGAARLPLMPQRRRSTQRPAPFRAAPIPAPTLSARPSAPSLTPAALTPAALQARVLHRDGLILVIDKPAGLPVHAGPG